MNEKEVFGMALGLAGTPWYVSEVQFDRDNRRLDIKLDFPPGSRFEHPVTKQASPVYDTAEQSWRHLNFFQFECYVHAFVPRVDGGPDGGVRQIEVPWARARSGFTLFMESLMVLCANTGMTVAELGRVVGEYPQRLWRVLEYHVEKAHQKMDLQSVQTVSVDEVSKRRGHDYLTVLSEAGQDGEPSRVLFVTEGKEARAITDCREFLEQRGVRREQIKQICSDMSVAYTKGIEDEFPDAQLIYDYFHVVQAVSKGVDKVRRRECKTFPQLLTGTRWLWLKGEGKLSEEEQQLRRSLLCRGKLHTGKAYMHLSALRDLMKQRDRSAALTDLKWWCGWLDRSRIPEMRAVSKTVKNHWNGIVAYLKDRITNGAAEALNGIIQTVKRKSRGFRTFRYFRIMIYLVASKLKFDLPEAVPTTHTTSH
jgi:transposase